MLVVLIYISSISQASYGLPFVSASSTQLIKAAAFSILLSSLHILEVLHLFHLSLSPYDFSFVPWYLGFFILCTERQCRRYVQTKVCCFFTSCTLTESLVTYSSYSVLFYMAVSIIFNTSFVFISCRIRLGLYITFYL